MLIVSTLCNVGKFKLNVSTTTAVRKDMSFFIPWNTFSRLWNKYSRPWKNLSRLWNSLWLLLLAYMRVRCLHCVICCITVVNASSVSNVGNLLQIYINSKYGNYGDFSPYDVSERGVFYSEVFMSHRKCLSLQAIMPTTI